jgi:hypothetical protein
VTAVAADANGAEDVAEGRSRALPSSPGRDELGKTRKKERHSQGGGEGEGETTISRDNCYSISIIRLASNPITIASRLLCKKSFS